MQIYIKTALEAGADYFVMEVSSHALDQRRVDGLIFRQAIFTNLTQDHLDYHFDMDNYFDAKKRFFTEFGAVPVINVDDAYGSRLCAELKKNVITYAIESDADIKLVSGMGGFLQRLVIKTPKGTIQVNSSLAGKHNVYNILAAVAAMISENISLAKIKEGVESLKNIPGRLESVDCGQPFKVFVDYAHTPEGLNNALRSIRLLTDKRLILVFGCGGDRDKDKRPKMGRLAKELCDYFIVTSDNPRSEEPQEIAGDIISGFEKDYFKFDVVLDRKDAIRKAIESAREGDVVLLAGKGHEDYQIFKDKTVPFDDRRIAKDILKNVYCK